MDKRVIFAVAGSGKTTFIINSLSLESNSLIVTFTNNNLHSLKTRIRSRLNFYFIKFFERNDYKC